MASVNESNIIVSGSNYYHFVRNSKLRQSIRIRSQNRKLPPSALIYMESLKKSTNSLKDPVTTLIPTKVEKPKLKKTCPKDTMEILDYFEETDESPLIRRGTSKRFSIKGVQKSSVKRSKKLNRLISFFR